LKANIISQIKGIESALATKKPGAFSDSGGTAKMAAAIYYKAATLEYLLNSERTQDSVSNKIFGQINKDFGSYTDLLAASNTARLHHVYEWKRAGDPSARLWVLKNTRGKNYNMSISYQFKQSKTNVPNQKSLKKYVFKEKARIMEYRIPVLIKPRSLGGRLVFEGRDGKTIFMPKGRSVVVNNPGGTMVYQGFSTTYNKFFTTKMVYDSIERSGVKKSLSSASKKAAKLPSTISGKLTFSRISASAVRSLAKSSASNASRSI
jgi:hypothetical protein